MIECHRTWEIIAFTALAFASTALSSRGARGDATGLTLEQALELSLANPSLLAAREAVVQARAEVETASAIPNPSLGIEVGMLPLSRQYTVEKPGGPPELAGGISYPLDWLLFGKRSAAIAAAEHGVGASENEYADVVRQRIAETKTSFYEVLEAEALLGAAQQAVADLGRVEAAIRKATSSGGRPQVDLQRVLLELQSAKREERLARSALASARAGLQVLVGKTGPASSLEVSGSLDVPIEGNPLAVEEAFAIASKHRPDIAALRNIVTKAQKEATVERRNAWPETSMSLGVAHQFQHSIGAPDVTAYGIGLEVGLPLFDRNQGGRTRAASAALQTTHELTAALAQLRAEIEQAVQELAMARENAIEMTQTDLELASQVSKSFSTSYEAGGMPLLDVLDAERSLRETYRAYIATRAEYWRALIRYEAALGRKVLL
ncbi:MAG: TolC family protein [Myxococcota bacterium]|jgi:cobalt-zinc-cadmium efflux system outer membrane protein|nr:TolC family protein [Myxococcota bacterium]